jgi:hypothetical protein
MLGKIFPGSAGASPALEAARMTAFPGYKRREYHGSTRMSGDLVTLDQHGRARDARGQPEGALPAESEAIAIERD